MLAKRGYRRSNGLESHSIEEAAVADSKSVKPRKLTWQDTLRAIGQPKVAVMLALGFAAGLPFMLVGNTLGYWLREGGIELTTIGFISWVGFAYSFKFLWAPLIDKIDAPLIGRFLGRRRGWMVIAQVLIAVGLAAMASVQPEGGIGLFTVMALVAAFASSTQDIVIDAWRIEVSESGEEMAMLSSSYQLGYRAALLVTDSLILILAAKVGWSVSYMTMAGLMTVGLLASFMAVEPKRALLEAAKKTTFSLRASYDAIVGPFIQFFKTYGAQALLILAAVSLYRLPDFFMGPMANPLYADIGIAKEVVGAVRGSFGLFASLAGIAAAGLCAVRFGLRVTLILGAIVGPASNLGFSYLAMVGNQSDVFSMVMVVDNFSTGFAGTALVGYMSSLTSIGYTATQYALLSSFYTLLGKALKGVSGLLVDSLKLTHPLFEAYAIFFFITAIIGIPAIVLCYFLLRRTHGAARATA
jgi:MFS transporter, PAT family, beta-lactamase induction signal transducer AmpG